MQEQKLEKAISDWNLIRKLIKTSVYLKLKKHINIKSLCQNNDNYL